MASKVIEIYFNGINWVPNPSNVLLTTEDALIFHVNGEKMAFGEFHSATPPNCHLTRLHPPVSEFPLGPPDYKFEFWVGTGSPCTFHCRLKVEGMNVVPDVDIDINP